jgi:hypothetical protein
MGAFEKKVVPIVGAMGYSIVPYAESQMRIEMFVGVNPPPKSRLADYFASTRGESPKSAIETQNIPWDVSNLLAVDYSNLKSLADATVALFPEFETQYGMGQDVMAGMLGFDAEAGFDKLIAGTVLVSFERIDILTNAIETYMEAADKASEYQEAYPEPGYEESVEAVPEGGPYEEGGSDLEGGPVSNEEIPSSDEQPSLDSAGEESLEPVEEGPPQNPLAHLPFTAAFQIPLEINRDALRSLLDPYMGETTTTRSVYGVEITTSQDGRVAYAFDGDWFYLSGARTVRLAEYMLAAAHGRKETLGSIDSWSRFTTQSRGRLLAFGHQKVDPFYSILKGFILLLGSEFRPLAVELGKLRDYHSVITAVPDGFLITGEIVQGDQR